MPTNKPSAGAVEAARKIAEANAERGGMSRLTITERAAIIDSTTHVGELRDVLTDLVQSYRVQAGKHASRQSKVLRRAESVLAKLPKE